MLVKGSRAHALALPRSSRRSGRTPAVTPAATWLTGLWEPHSGYCSSLSTLYCVSVLAKLCIDACDVRPSKSLQSEFDATTAPHYGASRARTPSAFETPMKPPCGNLLTPLLSPLCLGSSLRPPCCGFEAPPPRLLSLRSEPTCSSHGPTSMRGPQSRNEDPGSRSFVSHA